jgi:hypothetical protein
LDHAKRHGGGSDRKPGKKSSKLNRRLAMPAERGRSPQKRREEGIKSHFLFLFFGSSWRLLRHKASVVEALPKAHAQICLSTPPQESELSWPETQL